MMNKLLIISIYILLFLSSCNPYGEDKNLGSGFQITDYDGRYSPLEYYPYGIDKHSVFGIIEESVIKFDFNDKYIFAKTSKYDLEKSSFINNYWIVNKTKIMRINYDKTQAEIDSLIEHSVMGPFDSLQFIALMKEIDFKANFK